jgi:hypothetical protein
MTLGPSSLTCLYPCFWFSSPFLSPLLYYFLFSRCGNKKPVMEKSDVCDLQSRSTSIILDVTTVYYCHPPSVSSSCDSVTKIMSSPRSMIMKRYLNVVWVFQPLGYHAEDCSERHYVVSSEYALSAEIDSRRSLLQPALGLKETTPTTASALEHMR